MSGQENKHHMYGDLLFEAQTQLSVNRKLVDNGGENTDQQCLRIPIRLTTPA